MKPAYTVLFSVALLCSGSRPVKHPDHEPDQHIYQVNIYDDSEPCEIFLSPFRQEQRDSGQVMVFNEKGRLIRYKKLPGIVYDFRKWDLQGKTRYSYIVNDEKRPHIPTISQLTGYIVITDEELNEIRRIHLLSHKGLLADSSTVDLDVHDFIYISDEHYIAMAYYPKKPVNIPAELHPHPDCRVVAVIIQEVQNGRVIHQWDSSEFPELYAESVECNHFNDKDTVQDYLHVNSLVLDPRDGLLIASCRNTDQVLKIDLANNRIVWKLGGRHSDFKLENGQRFYRQHQLSVQPDGSFLLFDNGSQAARPLSRILEMQVDEAQRKVLWCTGFAIPAPFSKNMGSVQKFGERYFIGGGTGKYITEIDRSNGRRTLEFLSRHNVYNNYRAYKYPLQNTSGR